MDFSVGCKWKRSCEERKVCAAPLQPHKTQSITHVTEYSYFLATVANFCQRVEDCEGWGLISRTHHRHKLRIAVIALFTNPTMSTAFRSCFVLGGFILAYITYLILGALIFSAIERPVEETLKSDLNSLKAEFLNLSCINATALESFLDRVLKANKYGVSVLENASLRTNWDLASSLFFANTMVTTVGEFHKNKVSRMLRLACLMLFMSEMYTFSSPFYLKRV